VETTALARRIGTYDISACPLKTAVHSSCPPTRRLRPGFSDVERAEATLDVAKEAADIAEQAERIVL